MNRQKNKVKSASPKGLKKRNPDGIIPRIKKFYEGFYVGPQRNINLIGVGVVVFLLAIFPFFGSYIFEEHLDYIFPYLLSVGIIGLFLVFPFPEKLRGNTIWNTVLAILIFYLFWAIIQAASGIEILAEIGEDPNGIGQFTLATAIILGMIALFYALTGNIAVSITVPAVALFILGTVNHFIIEFRGDMLYAGDFLAVGTAAEVANGYQIIFEPNTFIALVMVTAIILCTFHMELRHPFKTEIRLRIVSFVFAVVCVFGFVVANPSQYLATWIPARNHYLVAFGVNVIQMHQPAPKNYSLESVRRIIENNQNREKGKLKPRTNNKNEGENAEIAADVKKPTVIAVMNESFSDLSVLGDLDINEDYLPFFHSLNSKDANIIKGKLYVDVFGGGTCNSEYSFLTGNTTAFLPENTRPFQLYVNNNTWSLAKTLKAQGYETHAMHPAPGTNWNRNVVYPELGFEYTYFGDSILEDYPELTRGILISDRCTYHKIINLYENRRDKAQFIFDVTIANHGGYDLGGTESLNHQVKGQGNLSDLEMLNEYLTVVRESDSALQELIAYFEKQEDPVVIVFFGDHQPKLEDDFYDRIKNKPKSEWNAEDNLSMQVTPYLIWSNYDFEGQAEDEDLSVNFLQQKLLKAAGIDETTAYDNYEASLVEDFPIVSLKGIVDKNGKYQSVRDAKSNETKINEYQQVVYNNMIDVKNTLTDLFTIESK